MAHSESQAKKKKGERAQCYLRLDVALTSLFGALLYSIQYWGLTRILLPIKYHTTLLQVNHRLRILPTFSALLSKDLRMQVSLLFSYFRAAGQHCSYFRRMANTYREGPTHRTRPSSAIQLLPPHSVAADERAGLSTPRSSIRVENCCVPSPMPILSLCKSSLCCRRPIHGLLNNLTPIPNPLSIAYGNRKLVIK